MVNAGKKRPAPGGGSSSGATSSGKKLKLANKAKSSKSGGKGGAAGASKSLASKQRTFGGGDGGAVRNGGGGAGGIPKRKVPAAGEDGKKKKLKGKGSVKEFVQLAKGKEVAQDGEDGADDDDSDKDAASTDDEEVVDVNDMLMPDSDGEEEDPANGHAQDFLQRSAFLTQIDKKELARSRAYLAQQHRLTKPAATAPTKGSSTRVPLPKIGPAVIKTNSDDEEDLDALSDDDFAKMGSSDFDDDSEDWGSDDSIDAELNGDDDGEDVTLDTDASDVDLGSDMSGEDFEESDEDDVWDGIDGSSSDGAAHRPPKGSDMDALEAKHADMMRKRSARHAEEERGKDKGLPVKLASGQIARNARALQPDVQESNTKNRVAHAAEEEEESDSETEAQKKRKVKAAQPKANPFGARFGRPAVTSVLEIEDRMERLIAAREELATLGREIIAEPELGMNLLKRLLSFTNEVFCPPGVKKEDGLPVDLPVRSLAMLSALAVFLDITPGYRIRPVTEAEKGARTSQAVIQQRDYEEGLVGSYRQFLETCEYEIKSESPLASVALKCLCELLKEKSYFNFSINIMEVVVKTLGRRDFDSYTETCINAISTILAADTVGQTSLQIVRLLSRTIRARSYLVHPAVLSCLLSLRIQDLGGIRASTDRIDRVQTIRRTPHYNNDKRGKQSEKAFLNKKARKAIKEKKEIEKEIAEAESTVKKEEREHNSTETLKLLFALYFRILKLPVEQNSQLLPPALEGLARYSQLINVDFFRDLLDVLKDIMSKTSSVRIQLLCVVTSLELLSGQGEALNIDLSAFITLLYGLIPSLTFSTSIEDKVSAHSIRHRSSYSTLPEGELLFRCLFSIFVKSRMPNPATRILAFSKRLTLAALHWPKGSALRALEFIRQLLVKDRVLESMLNTEDRRRDGVYKYDATEENLSNSEATVWWELTLLENSHFDEEVRAAAAKLATWTKDA